MDNPCPQPRHRAGLSHVWGSSAISRRLPNPREASVHFHRWQTIEATGRVITQRCAICRKTRVRVT